MNIYLTEQCNKISLFEEQGKVYNEILDLIAKKGLSVKQAHELCIVCAKDIYNMGINQVFLGDQ